LTFVQLRFLALDKATAAPMLKIRSDRRRTHLAREPTLARHSDFNAAVPGDLQKADYS
jgi:hypothetical protein